MKLFLSIIIPVALAGAGFLIYRIAVSAFPPVWDSEQVYAVWIEEAEVSPSATGDVRWDEDGSGPDLVASIEWLGNIVLKTPEASNTLVAHWERTALNLGDFLKADLSPTELENIARIRGTASDRIIIEIRDVDVLSTDWVAGISVPCGALAPGKNQISLNNSSCSLRSLTLRVVEVDKLTRGSLPERINPVQEGIVVLERPANDVPGAVEVREVGKQLESGAKFIRDLFNPQDSK